MKCSGVARILPIVSSGVSHLQRVKQVGAFAYACFSTEVRWSHNVVMALCEGEVDGSRTSGLSDERQGGREHR